MNVGRTIQVLIADDEAAVRNGLWENVDWKQLNMSVSCSAKDGLEAWEYIKEYKPDIVITDIRMPRMSGLELIKECRSHDMKTMFIILSGYDDFAYAQTAIRYGARAYVLKPLKIEELTAELETLKTELEHTAEEAVSDRPDYRQLQASSKKLFLNQLIHDEFRYESDIRAKLESFPHRLGGGSYKVIVFSLFAEEVRDCPELIQKVREIGAGLLEGHLGEIWVSNPARAVLLLHYPEEEEETVRQRLLSCHETFKAGSDCHMAIGVGSREEGLIHASASYKNAMNALSYSLYESGQVLYTESVIHTGSPALSSGNVDTEPLISAIRLGNAGEIRDYCRRYFRALLYVPMPPPSYIRGMSIYLVTDVQNALKRQITEKLDFFTEIPYVCISRQDTFRQIEEWVTELFLFYGEFLSQYFSNHKDGIIAGAKAYINSHIHQKIPAEEVAAEVNLSPSYFTVYFKAKTGINFRNYVLNMKMEEAKRLLEISPANINEIAWRVGYDDYRSFYRAFKNYTGMTPSRYQATYCS